MRKLVDLVKLDRLDSLIRRQATGCPTELAKRMGLSRSSLFGIIAYLREEMRAPIQYCENRNSYIYEYLPKFHLGFEEERLPPVELSNTFGGMNETDVEDREDIILDDDIDFNDLYLDDY